MFSQTAYNVGPAGAAYAKTIQENVPENKVFHGDTNKSLFRQTYGQFTMYQQAMIVQSFMNSGLGVPMTVDLVKNTDYLKEQYIIGDFPGLRINPDGGYSECSWVNAAAFYAIKSVEFKIGSQTVFTLDGLAMLIMTELMGLLDQYAQMIGYCKTKAQLIRESQFDRTLYAPLIGLPFQNRHDMAFATGGVTFHGMRCCVNTRSPAEMVVCYGNVQNKRGFYALPRQISNDQPIQGNSVHFRLGGNYIFAAPKEKTALVHGYTESMFREWLHIANFQIPASKVPHREVRDITIKGPVAFIAITIRSQADLLAGNWTKGCQNSGLDWVKELMVITGCTAIEDGLPPSFYRTGKILETFHHDIDRYTYVFSFEQDATSKQMTGQRTLTNSEGVKISGLYEACDSILEVDVHAVIYNAWYTEKGTGGKIWANC
jgi:hypothetical protein